MRKILTDFLTDRIAPLAKKISETNEELAHIESNYDGITDHVSEVETLMDEIEALRKTISATESELGAIDTAPPLVETPKKSSALSISDSELLPLTRSEELTRTLSSSQFTLETKEQTLAYHQKQLSFPKLKDELEAAVEIDHETLLGQVVELNKLILTGEKLSIFRWTKKLDLFSPVNGYGFMHFLAHYDILQYVLPELLKNSSIIANRELSSRFDELQSQQAILQMLGEVDRDGLPPIQRALVNGSIGSFKYILELPLSCKKGIFEVALDRSNIFHQAMLKGVFQDLIPYIEDGLGKLVADEGFIPASGTPTDHVKLMLTSENTKGYSPAKLAAYVASAPDFRYVFDTGVLKLNSGKTENHLEIFTESGRVISREKAYNEDLIRVSDKVIPYEADSSASVGSSNSAEAVAERSEPIFEKIVEIPLNKEDLLLDFLFRGLRHLEQFVIDLVDNGCVEIFDAILARQRITKDFALAKYIIQITSHVRNIKSLEADHPKFKEIISIYRKIFKEYWPQITINDNNLKAHDQLKVLAEQMDSLGGKVLGIPSSKLQEALGITESELLEHDGDIFSAAQNKLFDQFTQSYESDVVTKTMAVSNPLLATPSPVKINVRKIVSSTVKKEALRDCPTVLEYISKTVDEVEAVVEPTSRKILAEVTELNTSLRDLDSPNGEDGVELVKIEISKHIELIFELIVNLKDLPDNEDIKELYDQANPDAASPTDADVVRTILLLATGMRIQPGLFLDFVNDSICDANGEEVTIESFMGEFIAHIGIERLAAHGCVNFEADIANIVIEALYRAGKLTCDQLAYAIETDNQDAIGVAMSTGAIKWEDALLLAFEMDNIKFLDRYVEMTTLSTSEVAEISKNLFPPLLDSLSNESLCIYDTVEDETIAQNNLRTKAAFVATLLNGNKTSKDQGISFDTTLLEKFISVFDSFEDEGRKLDYTTIKQNLVFIAESLKPILAASDNASSVGFFIENDFAAQLIAATTTSSNLVDNLAPHIVDALDTVLPSIDSTDLSGSVQETTDVI